MGDRQGLVGETGRRVQVVCLLQFGACDDVADAIHRIDDQSQPSAASWFAGDADNGRPKIWRDIGISGVGEL